MWGCWGVDRASHLLQPSRRSQILRSAIPISTNNPRANKAKDREGHGIEQIEVTLGEDTPFAGHAVEVRAATVDSSFPHRSYPSHAEVACWVQVLGLLDHPGLRHPDEAPERDRGTRRVSPSCDT